MRKMKKGKRSSSNSNKKKNSFSEIIDNIIPEAEKNPQQQLLINNLSVEKGYEKRRLYDLFNVLSVYDLCEKSGSNSYIWKGISHTKTALIRIAKEVEREALSGNFEYILKLPDPASLVLIARRFIAIFLFLGKSQLPIHEMSTVMAPATVSPKKILRRLYLVAHILEHLKIINHTPVIGEYVLTFDVNKLNEAALNEMRENDEFPPDSLYSRLNRIENFGRAQIYKQRNNSYRMLYESRSHSLSVFESSPTEISVRSLAYHNEINA